MEMYFVFIGDKPDDYGRQKCWGSVGWGFFSMFIGLLVDWVSVNKKEKDYSPLFYSSILLTLCNLITIPKIKVRYYYEIVQNNL